MNKYKITRYDGLIAFKVVTEFDSITVESEDADILKVTGWRDLLTEKEKEDARYSRFLLISPDEIHIDFGSWSEFIKIERV